MPIASYLGFPRPGLDTESILAALRRLPHCEAELSEQGECLLVVTDTPDAAAEEELRGRLEALPELAGLSLVFAAEAAGEAP